MSQLPAPPPSAPFPSHQLVSTPHLPAQKTFGLMDFLRAHPRPIRRKTRLPCLLSGSMASRVLITSHHPKPFARLVLTRLVAFSP